MKDVRALILTGFGINCEEETAAAFRLAGAEADIHHLNDVFNEKCSIHDYHVIGFPGGFSFGDDIAAAKVLANKLKYRKIISGRLFMDEMEKFLGDGKYIMGICNGFQVLVKTGLLPDTLEDHSQQVTLTYNDSGKFEDRWITCKVNPESRTPFLQGIDLIPLPVRHGEGKLLIKDEKVQDDIRSNALNCMSYCDPDGNVTSEYPLNPNGSELNCAALTDKSGHVFGLMPHPEAFTSIYNHPNWGHLREHASNDDGDGLKIFRNIVRAIGGE
ncbi:phosphoribosylformylglycinamidine synthase subunit PurQ [candidate division KSB1 bacterium]|nr:phosphoribosylformylglycinamidine synthase subunit PurQ [candidate division KSB1 bacterium]